MPRPDTGGGLAARMFVGMQHVLPQHTISRLVYRATRNRSVGFKNRLIRWFVGAFAPDMSDAEIPDPLTYATFNEFFTRALRAGARPVDADERAIVSPADGTVSAVGEIRGDTLIQAKGHDYTLAALLADRRDWVERFRDGTFATIYLAPYNYHRVHMPLPGTLREAWYVPGRLFSVNASTTAAVPDLFARNERVICFFEHAGQAFAVILVGALNVGSMSTVWHGEVTPRKPRRLTQLPVDAVAASASCAKGAEMGRFNMGSTVIVLLPRGACTWSTELAEDSVVRVGQRIGAWRA